MTAALTCTFCGSALELHASRCRGCGGPVGQHEEWPENEGAVRFLVRTAPDARGRQDFYALWWANGLRRGRRFFRSDLEAQVSQARRDGVEVEIVERFGLLREAA